MTTAALLAAASQLNQRHKPQLQKPVTHAEFAEAVKRTDQADHPATILEFRVPTKQ